MEYRNALRFYDPMLLVETAILTPVVALSAYPIGYLETYARTNNMAYGIVGGVALAALTGAAVFGLGKVFDKFAKKIAGL